MAKTEFQAFLDEEVSKVKGIYYPVKAGFLRRLLVNSASPGRLHPNPGDEFCFPEIGPNYEIISGYEKQYRKVLDNPLDVRFLEGGAREPLMVEKTRPDGYMLLNGHHRWAAARRVGLKKIRIRIVDLTQEKDIRKMIEKATSDQRVTLDLDEVVFRTAADPCVEKPLRFPLNRIYRERLRLGIPALFHALNEWGYDIWVYTSGYYSLDYLKYYFKHYHVRVAGIITGTGRKTPGAKETGKKVEKLLADTYRTTIHVDNDLVLRTERDTKEFEEHPLSEDAAGWSGKVMDIVKEMMKHEKKA